VVPFLVDLSWQAAMKWQLQNAVVLGGTCLVALLSLQALWFQGQNQQKTLDNP